MKILFTFFLFFGFIGFIVWVAAAPKGADTMDRVCTVVDKPMYVFTKAVDTIYPSGYIRTVKWRVQATHYCKVFIWKTLYESEYKAYLRSRANSS